jgi:CO/xanthine dehydrogenase Mo-binding subunit
MFLRPILTILAVMAALIAGLMAVSKPQPPVKLTSTRQEFVAATTFSHFKGNTSSDISMQDGRTFEMDGRVIAAPGTRVTVQAFSDTSARLCFDLGQPKPWCRTAWATVAPR